MNIEKYPDLMKLTEVAEYFRVNKITIKRWEKSEKLIPIRINSRGDRRYNKKDVLGVLTAHKQDPSEEVL